MAYRMWWNHLQDAGAFIMRLREARGTLLRLSRTVRTTQLRHVCVKSLHGVWALREARCTLLRLSHTVRTTQ